MATFNCPKGGGERAVPDGGRIVEGMSCGRIPVLHTPQIEWEPQGSQALGCWVRHELRLDLQNPMNSGLVQG